MKALLTTIKDCSVDCIWDREKQGPFFSILASLMSQIWFAGWLTHEFSCLQLPSQEACG